MEIRKGRVRMRIGIVIPYYENQPVMKERLEWLIRVLWYQLPEDEVETKVVVVDDGCNAKWLDEYDYNWLTVVHNAENIGVSAARNVGIELLIDKTDYIGFLDGDDNISSDYLKEAYKLMQLGVDFIDSRFVQDGSEIFGTLNGFDRLRNMVRDGVAGCFYKNSIIGDKRFDEKLQIGEDKKFNDEVVDLSKHKKEISAGIYIYNHGINTDSLTMRHDRGQIGEQFERGFLTEKYYKAKKDGSAAIFMDFDYLNKNGVRLHDCMDFAEKMKIGVDVIGGEVVKFVLEGENDK